LGLGLGLGLELGLGLGLGGLGLGGLVRARARLGRVAARLLEHLGSELAHLRVWEVALAHAVAHDEQEVTRAALKVALVRWLGLGLGLRLGLGLGLV